MNDKWNPRLWLRDWLNKPSNAGATSNCLADEPSYKIQPEAGKVIGISITADLFSVTPQSEPPSFREWLARNFDGAEVKSVAGR